MIDIHTHVLFEVDHGANTIKDSLELLKTLEESGTREIYLTSHYYSDSEPVDSFLERYEERLVKLSEVYTGGVSLKRGAEVYISPYFASDGVDRRLCLEGTNHMLVELPCWRKLPAWVYTTLQRIISYGVVPIIAHAERYPGTRRKSVIKSLIKIGALLQVDTYSVKEELKRARWLIKKNYCDFLASDVHADTEYLSLSDAIELIYKKFGKDVADRLKTASRRITEL